MISIFCFLFAFFLFILMFFMGFFGYSDSILYKHVDNKNIFSIFYFCGWEKYCERQIDFPLFGIWVFTGKQGSGKTLSMVRQAYLINKNYDNVVMKSNFNLPFTQYIHTLEEVFPLKRSCIAMDEIGIIANSKKSKDINETLLRVTAQNRKNKRIILTTSQQLFQCNKDIRTQATYIIECSCIFKRLFINKYYTPIIDNDGNIKKTIPSKIDYFIATEKLYQLYDTCEVIG